MLVGQKRYEQLNASDLAFLRQYTAEDWPNEQTIMGTYFRSIYMPNHGHIGQLYRVGEFVLVKSTITQLPDVIRLTNIFSVRSTNTNYSLLKGELYPGKRAADGTIERHIYSSSIIVEPSSTEVTAPAVDILRKVMLFPDPAGSLDDPNAYVVVDYLRSHVPLTARDVVIPYWPEKGEMVLVDGDGEEVWLGHVQKVDTRNKLCHLHFYIKTRQDTNLYQREQVGHRSLESVDWVSIRGKARGFWCGRYWKLS